MQIFRFKKIIFLLLPLLAIQILTGCAPAAVSQEQYNAVQAELKSTKEQLAAAKAELANPKTQTVPVQKDQLAAPRKTLADVKPYLDLDLLILEGEITLSQQNTKEITVSYANIQYADQRTKLTALLKKFDDKAFASAVESAWSDSTDTRTRWESWTQTYSMVHDKLKENFDLLSSQLSP